MEGGRLVRIISGGQTGVDRAALDVAMARGLPCGGWVPRGRRAEDGRLPLQYPMRESRRNSYEERTRLNVRDADGTLILTRGRPIGGTALTAALAQRLGKPYLLVDLENAPDTQRQSTSGSTSAASGFSTSLDPERAPARAFMAKRRRCWTCCCDNRDG